ncbi:MAG: hypothetical protein ETSY1_30635 [Candidatus Entotheonella factor]|uniref:Uncharacterized protein n=1 Tax=Entotheonella factor TaxID=1429438 RepID=W4LCK1_ENTF1|nr:MAG: hypothetical protein ETSY1_30635 [Candidatus Entotheonella factor]
MNVWALKLSVFEVATIIFVMQMGVPQLFQSTEERRSVVGYYPKFCVMLKLVVSNYRNIFDLF